jgi:hypothetical protein
VPTPNHDTAQTIFAAPQTYILLFQKNKKLPDPGPMLSIIFFATL